jgi:putative DNA primase/helicase
VNNSNKPSLQTYLDAGLAVFPVEHRGKKPHAGFKWRNAQLPACFSDVPTNIGLRLDQHIEVDPDDDRGVCAQFVDRFFTRADANDFCWGRKSRRGKRLFRIKGDLPRGTTQWTASIDVGGAATKVFEIKWSSSHYTILPPGEHASGEAIEHEHGEIGEMAIADALARGKACVLGVILLKYWSTGQRDELFCAAVRALKDHSQFTEGNIRMLLSLVMEFAGDEERSARLEKFSDKYERPRQGMHVLKKIIGNQRDWDTFRSCLDDRDHDDADDGRALVEVRDGQQEQALTSIREVLVASPDLEVVEFAGELVHPFMRAARGYDEQPVQTLVLNKLSAAALAAKINRKARFVRATAKSSKVVDCPPSLTSVFMALPEDWHGIPKIERITETPVLTRAGTLHATPGYCAGAAAWVNAPPNIRLPERCDKTEAAAALARLRDWLSEFPFEGPTDEAVAVALLLTAALRASTALAPGFVIDKPEFGSGASTLGALAGVVLSGREPPVITPTSGRDGAEELRKQFDSAQLEGASGIFLDNFHKGRAVDGIVIAQSLSQAQRKVRILGQTRTVDVPCGQLLVVTGNNIRVVADLVRRFMRCRLDAKMERPHERVFKRPAIVADAIRERVQLLADCYTVVVAYMRSGDAVRGTPLVNYRQWTSWVQEPLLWLGMPDVVLSARAFEEDDDERLTAGEIIATWADGVGSAECTVKQVLDLAMGESSDRPLGKLRDTLLGSVRVDGSAGEDKVTRAIGSVLNSMKGQVADGMRIVKAGTTGGKARWRAERVDGGRLQTLDEREGTPTF